MNSLPFHVSPTPTDVFMIDIETAGLAYGSAILEIAAAEFNPATGEILREWHSPIDMLDSTRLGLKADQDTSRFHLAQGYDGSLRGATLWRALNGLDTFLHLNSERPVVWAWGLDFETLHLKASCDAAGYRIPWEYRDGRCARTVWKLAFAHGVTMTPRAHRALDDVRAQVSDLTQAIQHLSKCHA